MISGFLYRRFAIKLRSDKGSHPHPDGLNKVLHFVWSDKEVVDQMKPTTSASGFCSPKDLQKLARLATRVIMNRIIPNGQGTPRRLLPVAPPPFSFSRPR